MNDSSKIEIWEIAKSNETSKLKLSLIKSITHINSYFIFPLSTNRILSLQYDDSYDIIYYDSSSVVINTYSSAVHFGYNIPVLGIELIYHNYNYLLLFGDSFIIVYHAINFQVVTIIDKISVDNDSCTIQKDNKLLITKGNIIRVYDIITFYLEKSINIEIGCLLSLSIINDLCSGYLVSINLTSNEVQYKKTNKGLYYISKFQNNSFISASRENIITIWNF